jgi:hypothetical protein
MLGTFEHIPILIHLSHQVDVMTPLAAIPERHPAVAPEAVHPHQETEGH